MHTVDLTAEELGLVLDLVKAEQLHYEDSEDDTDVAQYNVCDSVINKLYNAQITATGPAVWGLAFW